MHTSMVYITFLVLLTLIEVARTVMLFNVRKHIEQGRTLTFPVTAPTRLQFIGGIGIPVEDLNFESITSGYVLKAEYFLPTRAEEFRPIYLRPQTIHRRSLSTNSTIANITYDTVHRSRLSTPLLSSRQSSTFGDNWQSKYQTASAYRWIIYKSAEIIMNRAGLPGRTCVLRSICEHASTPLHFESGILAEILHIVLSPSSSHDDFGKFNNNDYINAEKTGRANAKCAEIYSKCSVSLIDKITTIIN